ncbi:hypothetical protein MKEN_01246100 [Mycena kentingensis (nom. inval.)]|nr:hypothetical protein MKEN_01246100 [Mycena kentingensis (nom. inval.)]
MGCLRPATPGFILTALATALLAVVSFCVPYFKSVFFLQADITSSGVTGTITFGTLGYCVELSGTTTCSKPSIGYELDINSLVGNKLPVEIPTVVVKWLTYVLFLHVVALVLAAGAAIFGLLAHVREMSMACCSTCISGFAAAVALVAFIFDLALFFVAKSRINSVGKATMGNAIWLTLAAWILLFFSGCFYTLGRCCISNRKRGDWNNGRKDPPDPHAAWNHQEQMRLDAVKAEADRKARQKASEEGGLPAFSERQPLTAYDDGHGNVTFDKPEDDKPHTLGGYMPAAAGTRTVDQYYDNASGYNNSAYPPAPQRNNYAPSTYAPSSHSYNAPAQRQNTYPNQQYQSTPPPPMPQHSYPQSQPPMPMVQSQYSYPQAQAPPQPTLSPPPGGFAALGAIRTASPAQQQPNPYLEPNPYLGHGQGISRGTSYHSAASHGAEYSQYDPYESSPAQAQAHGAEYFATQQQQPPLSQYTSSSGEYDDPYGGYSRSPQAGGDGYGGNSVPPLDTRAGGGYFPQTQTQTQAGPSALSPTSPKGPRSHRQSLYAMNRVEEDSPPEYEQGSEHVPGAWGKS